MKLCTLFFALALGATSKQATKAMKQQDNSQGADGDQGTDQSDGAQQSHGYGEPADQGADLSDGAQQSYGYAEPAFAVATPRCCVSWCPNHAPFFSTSTCSCVPGYVEQDTPAYQNWGYSGQTYSDGAQQQTGYRHLQAYEDFAHSDAPSFTSSPDGTVDTRHLRINHTGKIVLWIAFGILFICAMYYLRMFSYYYHTAEDMPNQHKLGDHDLKAKVYTANSAVGDDDREIDSSILHFLANPSLIAGAVCLIASLAYLTMATDNGWYTRCHDGRQFFFARYIDWVVTTPLMLHALAHFANSPNEIWNFLFFTDVLMIVSGLVASTITGPEKWIYYGFAILSFIPVLYYICKLRDQSLDNRLYNSKTGIHELNWIPATTVGNTDTRTIYLPYIWFFHNYQPLADLTVVAWFFYPIVWIFAEGTDILSVTGEAITYTILDLISKGIFGWMIVNSTWENPHDKFKHRYRVKVTANAGPLN